VIEDYGNHVEILGHKFPACNIQIWEESPELHHVVGFDLAKPTDNECVTFTFGIYFEIMLESGTVLIVSQEAASEANGECSTLCKEEANFLNHFHVEEYHKDTLTQVPYYAWHCSGEEELVAVLRPFMKRQAA
jgi:hypothetical protein